MKEYQKKEMIMIMMMGNFSKLLIVITLIGGLRSQYKEERYEDSKGEEEKEKERKEEKLSSGGIAFELRMAFIHPMSHAINGLRDRTICK